MAWSGWRKKVAAACLLMAAGLGGGCYRPNLRFVAQEEQTYRLDLGPGRIVELWTGHGSIEVQGEARPDLTVRARFSALGVTQAQADARLPLFRVIGRTLPLGAMLHVDLDSGEAAEGLIANLEAAVPPDVALRLAAATGAVRVVGVRGPVDAETHGGSVYMRAVQGAVRVRTSDGAVVGEDLALEGMGVASRVETVNGSVRIEISRLDHPLEIECRAAPVDLILPADGAYAFDIQTRKGAITLRDATGVVAESPSGKRLRYQSGPEPVPVPVVVSTTLGDVLVRLRSRVPAAAGRQADGEREESARR